MGRAQEAAARRAGVTDPRVLAAVAAVDRAAFVPPGADPDADAAVAIGEGQTTSQPSLVALTLQHLDVGPGDRVLDVGAGSGYQAALLSHLAGEVVGLEVLPSLARQAADRLAAMGLADVRIVVGDAWGDLDAAGLPADEPFDAIVVGAEAPEVPDGLLARLAPGGRLLMPLGARGGAQLTLLTKRPDGRLDRREILAVRFVPLVRDGA